MDPSKSWCIVALPEEGHVVHKVSSEKKPHLTILFLGEQSEPALAIRIIETIQHTINTSFKHKFSLGVQRRGLLGEDQADVLFFYKDEAGCVKDFRDLLLKNDDIKKCYDSTFQYPEWTPHLTLGYPNKPAKPLPNDQGPNFISWITFDRIALWIDDSDGPEIRLGDDTYAMSSPDAAYHIDRMILKGMNAIEGADDFLAHYGVKGMRWGHRKPGTGEPSDRKAAKAEKKAEKQTAKAEGKIARKAGRREIAKNLGSEFSLKTGKGQFNTGVTAAAAIFSKPAAAAAYVGIKTARSAGYSKGKSVAIGLIGGPPGALLAAELSVRKNARREHIW